MRRWAERLFVALIVLAVAVSTANAVMVGARMLRAWAIVNDHIPAPSSGFVHNVESQGLMAVSGATSWWGPSWRIPTRDGGDYLAVLARREARNLKSAWVLGALVERERRHGVTIDRVIIPEDTSKLFLEDVYWMMERADGSVDARPRNVFSVERVGSLSNVELKHVPYDPVLQPEELRQLEEESELEYRGHGFFIARAPVGTAGTWMLHVDPAIDSQFYLIPLELSPVGSRP